MLTLVTVWCGSAFFPNTWFVTPTANCHSFIINEEALPGAWLQRFGGLWSSTLLDFVAVLDVLKSTDPRLALVSLGLRPATAQFLVHLRQYLSQQLERLACKDVSSSPTVKLPSHGPPNVPLSPAATSLMEQTIYGVELDIATVLFDSEVYVDSRSDVPSANVSVKLPGAHQQQSDGRCGTAESRSAPNTETQIVLRVANGRF